MRTEQAVEGNEVADETYDTALDDPEVQQEENNPDVHEENFWEPDDDYDPAHEQDVWEEHVNEIMNEPTPRHRERSRSRDGYIQRAHRRGVHWADQGEDLDAYTIWSPVWPRSPPSAQPDRVPRPLVTDGIEIGRIMAAPRALLSQVLTEFAISHKFECLIHVEPMGAVEWRHVESLRVEAPGPRTSYHLDLREGPWERYQSIRHVPVLIEGMPVDTVLFPWHLPLHLAQARLDDDTHVQQNWMVCAVNTDNWVIVRLRIPSSILEDLDDLETYRQEAENIGYRRAGAPLCLTCSERQPYVSLRVILAHEPTCATTYGVPEKENMAWVLAMLANRWDVKYSQAMIVYDDFLMDLDMPASYFAHRDLTIFMVPYCEEKDVWFYLSRQKVLDALAYQHGSGALEPPYPLRKLSRSSQDLISEVCSCPAREDSYMIRVKCLYPFLPEMKVFACENDNMDQIVAQVAVVIDEDPGNILMLYQDYIVPLHDKAKNYLNGVVLLMVCLQGRILTGLACPLRDPLWRVCHDQRVNFESEVLSDRAYWSPRDVQAWFPNPAYIPVQEGPWSSYIRRAGARGDRPVQPKHAMQQWALQKAEEHAPEVSQKTLHMILKAEAKTCSALLHSQSVAQTHQIIEAAFKRAGLSSPFAPPRENDEETQSDPKRARFENDVIVALTNQVQITNQIAEQFKATPQADEYVRLSDVFKTSQEASIKAVASLATVVGKMEQRMQQWEETFLPHVLERLPIPVPPSPNDSQQDADFTQPYEDQGGRSVEREGPGDPTRDQQQQAQEVIQDTNEPHSEEQPGQAMSSQPHALAPSSTREEEESLQPMQERSLRNCCARIVRPSGQATALRPFRA